MKEAVIGIVVTDDQKIVLTKRADAPIWVLPGGGIDSGETPDAAVIREIREETGLQVRIRHKCAEYLPANSLSAKTHLFVCSIDDGSLQLSDETHAVGLFLPGALPSPFFILHKEWLKDWQSYNGSLICKTISQVNYFAILRFAITHPIIFLKYLYSKKIKGC